MYILGKPDSQLLFPISLHPQSYGVVYSTKMARAAAITRAPCAFRPLAPLSEEGAEVVSLAAAELEVEEGEELLESVMVEPVSVEEDADEPVEVEALEVMLAVESVAVEPEAVAVLEPVEPVTLAVPVAVPVRVPP